MLNKLAYIIGSLVTIMMLTVAISTFLLVPAILMIFRSKNVDSKVVEVRFSYGHHL